MSEDRAQPERKRRGRPVSPEKTRQTEMVILEAATALFLEEGFGQTTMDMIARRADVAKGTLYLYYPTKTAMLEAVVSSVIAEPIVAVATQPPGDGETVQAFLRRVFVPMMRQEVDVRREGVIRLIVTEGARFPELAAIYRGAVLDPLYDFLRQLARQAHERGELLTDSRALERFPLLLISPILMATAWNGLHEETQRIDAGEAFEALLDLLFSP